MAEARLEQYADIVPDDSTTPVRRLGREGVRDINRQTAFNRRLLEGTDECGCFHCGRRFPTSLVTSWIEEDGEEDSGVCPFCGVDALVVGTSEHPLTTALLSELYESQFEREAKETLEATNDCPQFSGEEGYLREGIPFRRRALGGRRHLMSVGLWSIGDSGEDYYDCEGAPSGGIYTDEALGGTWTVRAWEEIDTGGRSEEELSSMDDEEYWSIANVIEHFQLVRGETVVRFTPWSGGEQSTLLELSEEYGDRLVGLFKTPHSGLEVYVDEVIG
ncbi:MAG: hypothetical protein UHI81_01845 [Olegusella sp.]|nr:hypothetical protein [Olegusella sp.]